MERAAQITAKFLRFYHHAAPFDRKALSATWASCREPACEKTRGWLEARIGSLPGRANAPPVEATGDAAP